MDGKGNALAADMYRPKMQDGSLLPVIIFSHGGGLFVGTKRMNRLFCEIISRMGFVVYSLDYRLIDKSDGLEEISDICAAFRFIKENLHEHGGDPEKIFVCGESRASCQAGILQ